MESVVPEIYISILIFITLFSNEFIKLLNIRNLLKIGLTNSY